MGFLDYFRVALKNLIRQKTRTFLTIIAITVGSLSLILMASIIVSIQQSLVDQFQELGAFSLVTVVKDPNAVNNNSLIGSNGDMSEGKMIDDTTLTSIRAIPHVAEATTILVPWVKTIHLEGEKKKAWGNITGFNPTNDVFKLSLAYGRKLTSSDMDKIIVGGRFIEDAGYSGHPKDLLGKHVIFNMQNGGSGSAPDWGSLPAKPPQNADKSWYESNGKEGIDIPVEIVGILDSSVIDDGQSYINIAWARKLMVQVRWDWDQSQPKEQSNCEFDQKTGKQNCSGGQQQPNMVIVKDDQFTTNGYSSIIIRVDDQANITSVSDAVAKLGYGANTAQSMLDQINRILTMIGVVLALIGGISLFVASIGIINTMIMATFERTREIGVMRACGATRGTIRKLFTFEAGLLGFWGGVFGIVISLALGQAAHVIVTKMNLSLGNIPIERIGNFPWWLIVGVIVFTSLLGMVAGLYPAVRASRMDPVDALRYE